MLANSYIEFKHGLIIYNLKVLFLSPLSRFLQKIVRTCFLSLYFRFVYKVKVINHHKIDHSKNYLFVSNHRSLLDPPLVAYASHRPVAFIAKKELFEPLLLRWVITLASAIPVDRSSVKASTMKMVKKALNTDGWSAGIYIEGTRSKIEGQLGKPNSGAIYMAKLAKAPIVPVGVTYTTEKEVRVEIGEPYEIDYKGDLEEQAWSCLEKISKLCDYKMPPG